MAYAQVLVLAAAFSVALGSPRVLSVNTAALPKGGAAATGILESKIIGGTSGRLADAPSTVQLELLQNGAWLYTCAGVLVNGNHIATACHCVADPNTKRAFSSSTLRVRVGSDRSESGGTVVNVRRVQLHPKWTTSQPSASIEYGDFDVAVLTLSRAVSAAAARPAKLAAVGNRLAAETVVNVWSWGITALSNSVPSATVKKATFRVIVQATCDALYQKRGARVSAQQFCIRSATSKALCTGDSGAPVARASDGAIVGLFSWGSCGVDANPGVITDLRNRAVRSFVDSAIKV